MTLKADGTVIVWGDNWAGQTNIPPGLTNVTAIAAAGRHCLALLGDGPPLLHAEAFNAVLTNGSFSLSIPTESGRVYRLEYATSPGEASWTPLSLKLGTGEPIELIDPATFHGATVLPGARLVTAGGPGQPFKGVRLAGPW